MYEAGGIGVLLERNLINIFLDPHLKTYVSANIYGRSSKDDLR
jgi:hypothetical protein